MLDIVIISVPGTISDLPPAAPALLKASVEAAGFGCKTIDFNLRLNQNLNQYPNIQHYFTGGMHPECDEIANELIKEWVEEILLLKPKFVGISVFTYQNRIATKLFCHWLRKLSDVKIVLGGQGISEGGILGKSKFAADLQQQGLVDFWIRSEGEISLVELLKNNTEYIGINSDTFQQIEDLDSLPFPNYDDYEIDRYGKFLMPITGSRGCVRACTFCDIHDHWKYRYRSGQSIFNEILHVNKKYNATKFVFSDSLINGNLKEFKKFIEILAAHNKTLTQPIRWSSQFIIRSSSQLDDDYWKNIALSGGTDLAIGVESGSNRVLDHMNKKFTVQDLDYNMEMMSTHNITCTFLMMVGYPTETDEDFQQTLDLFTRYKSYAGNVIQGVSVGSTLGILPGTPLYQQAKELNIELDSHENNWIALNNKDLSIDVRLQRRERLQQHLQLLGFKVKDFNHQILEILESKLPIFKKRLEIKKLIRIKNLNQ